MCETVVCDNLCGDKLCVDKLCVNKLCVDKLCEQVVYVRRRRAGGGRAGAGVERRECTTKNKNLMWGKRNEHHPWWNGGIPIAMFDY